MIRHRAKTAALLAPLAGLLACANGDTEATPRASLRVGYAAPAVRESGQPVAFAFNKQVLTRETLVTIGNDGRIMPRILESWTSTPDGLVWRLKVRRGIRFHDGSPVTAPELTPQMSAELSGYSLGAVQSVEAEGDDVIRIALREPYGFLLEDISLITAQRTVDGKTYYTGPYAIVEDTPDRLVVRAVDEHYRGDPTIDQVDARLYPDQRNAWSALMRGEIDMLYSVSRDSLDFIRSESSISVSTFTRPFVFLLGLNHAHPQLRNARVRRALDLAVDRDALIATGLANEAEPADGHVWPHHWAYDSSAANAYDPQRARQLLEEAGLPLQREPGRMPARLRLRCAVYPPMRKLALVLQRQLAAVDVDLQLELVPYGEMIERLPKGDYDTFVFEMVSARGLKWPYQFWHSSTLFLEHGYAGADDVLEQLRVASTDEDIRRAVSAVQHRFKENPPAIFLAWPRESRAVSRQFQVEATAEDVYHTVSRWKLAANEN